MGGLDSVDFDVLSDIRNLIKQLVRELEKANETLKDIAKAEWKQVEKSTR